jgi:uncharacterized protein YjeT (DUF2065 family)
MKLFLLVLGFTLFLEGVPYFMNPSGSKHIMRVMIRRQNSSLRWFGFGLAVGGIILMYLARST